MTRTILAAALAAVAALALGCGGSDSADPETAAATSPAAATEDSLETRAAENIGEDWPTLWCQARLGMTRDELANLMGPPPYPDSGRIPLVDIDRRPPEPVGSDTWEAPGTHQYNAFYDRNLRVQQLDLNGPDDAIRCSPERIRP